MYVNNDTYRGVFGLGDHDDRENATLFLEDGVYSMSWSNSFATYPFLMGRAMDTTWFGVFYKNLAAQDWWLKSNKVTGEIDVETYALSEPGTYGTTQGVYILMSQTPEEVTAILHAKVLTGRHHFTPYWSLGWQ